MADTGAGRFAPSPSGRLHVGNLRTAVVAWLFARSTGRRFLIRIEDLDRVRAGAEAEQLAELVALGITSDSPVVRQSERTGQYAAALDRLMAQDLVYECFCTRRDVAEAASAPHARPGFYPGTCRDLTDEERGERRGGRPPALRLRSGVETWEVDDLLAGWVSAPVDDVVLRRNDGVIAYNLAVVVDDAAQGVDQVVRGDDLLESAPRQAYLASLLGLPTPVYAHVPLAVTLEGRRLAKRDGAVTLEDLAAEGCLPPAVLGILLDSLGLPTTSLAAALDAFDPGRLPQQPWVVVPPDLPSTAVGPACKPSAPTDKVHP
ncbi:tRNA glutamyl-Q(34) synthetase GluQRS [Arthrobacter agilis]|uniref:tRNA glutamyl-Q(34) synthetase GluQRS n=1 Tax=Arthrobacter agilis TaxID=37921 RepID=UPI000B35185C|nr:tRNA glutamyl-Q(34) synthetase GluQRS [Arthrobacter agilis]OUM43668.1 tRNA glutamyl-Q(34) synthetase GluQRS [Arthrobacter agilis]PPB46745.1 tRNA glutamyl-Q(34) synthetase GluQRS [Arthrobacter agilis]TPV24913.1 tRNA glutamyl-Q(34) synthetase GluQRS [Arthrobacter agilis]VDR31080.1 Glutamate--tRNA ligase [Arthrobacter agilis]